jgi:hypothetical protein
MKPSPTDIDPLTHRWRNLVPLTGLTASQTRTVCTLANQPLPPAAGRPWGLPPPVRVLLVLIHLRTNLTTRALGALVDTSQSAVDRVLDHLVPVLSRTLRPNADNSNHPWIIDATLIPVHDQSITAISKNYRRSVNTQIIIRAHRRRVIITGQCWPANRNDVVVARHTITHPLGGRDVLADDGDRGITSTTTPRPDHTGRIVHHDHYRNHRQIRARIEHVIARLKDWQIPRQCRRPGDATNHILRVIAGLWNLNTHTQLRVTS